MRGLAAASLAAALALGGCALPEVASPSIPIEVMKPDGAGPFPAIVMLHDCSGLGPRSSGAPRRWARELVRQGYAVAIPDSFSTRGHAPGVCTNPDPSRLEVAPLRRVRDAYEALAHLKSLAYVDGTRIGVMGGSHGGSTTLATLIAPPPDGKGFAAAVALYPGCWGRYGEWRPGTPGIYKPRAPLLILIGEKDDWTPAEPCRQLTERSREAGYPVAIKIYPGAQHSFDNNNPLRFNPERVNGSAPGGRGATTQGNPEAWRDSIAEVTAFFARHLKKE